jgi:hypothetical protein
MTYTKEHLEKSFWPNVVVMMDDRGCHEWIAALSHGYGAFTVWDKAQKKHIVLGAHRIAWEIENGPIPKASKYIGAVIRHKCDNRSCVNPKHLLLGTHKDNVQDQIERNRFKAPEKKLVCYKGHPKEQTYVVKGRIYLRCQTCSNEINLKSYYRNKKL